MAILFHRAGEQAKPLDFFCPRVRLSIVLVEVVGLINYKNLSVVCSQNSHGQWISNHLVSSAIIFTSQDLLKPLHLSTQEYFKTILWCSPDQITSHVLITFCEKAMLWY